MHKTRIHSQARQIERTSTIDTPHALHACTQIQLEMKLGAEKKAEKKAESLNSKHTFTHCLAYLLAASAFFSATTFLSAFLPAPFCKILMLVVAMLR